MRLFFAVDFSDAVKSAIGEAIQAIPIKNPPWRWVAVENLHITLKFLGEMTEDDVHAVARCAEAVAGQFAAFRISLGGLSGFPNLESPRVLFYRLEEGAGRLEEIAARLDHELSTQIGVKAEKRPFRGHATIARIKTRLPDGIVRKLEAVPSLGGTSQPVERIALMKSELSPQGARYHRLKAFALSKSK